MYQAPALEAGAPEAVQPSARSSADYPELELPEIPAADPAPAPVQLYDPPTSTPKSKKGSAGWRLFAAAVALVTLSAAVGSGSTYYLMKTQQTATPVGYVPSTTMQPVAQTVAEAGASVIPAIYQKVAPSVVSINVVGGDGFYRTAGSGSGFVVDPSGHILTNYHVIEDAQRITVEFVDGTNLSATVVGKDRATDLAVLKVDPEGRTLVAAPLGDSDQVQVGELAIAIGNPYGHEFTVTAGIVSALDREIVEEASSIPGAIQTDAAINPGNSGGPLLNSRGEVIGINTAIEAPTQLSGNVGLGFAVPVNLAKEILPALMAGETIQRPYLGVYLYPNPLDDWYVRVLGLDSTDGALVMQVEPDSAADKAGLRSAEVDRFDRLVSADVIVAIDGEKVKDSDDLVRKISEHKVGDTVTLTVIRDQEELTLTATLGSRPTE